MTPPTSSISKRIPAVAAWLTAVLMLGAAIGLARTNEVAVREAQNDLPRSEPFVRIRVATALDDATVAGSGRLLVSATNDGRAAEVPFNGEFNIAAKPGGLASVSDGPTLARARSVTIVPDLDTSVAINGERYPGRVTLIDRSDERPGTMDLIAEVPMEAYIAGVITAELYANWEQQAYEAQAIAARSYALHQQRRARASGRAWDLESTTRDQVFKGLSQRAVAQAAVDATRGLVLVHLEAGEYLRKADVLRAYYSSSCGGRPNDAAEVWRTSKGYEFNLVSPLQAEERVCPCHFAGLYRWDRERTEADLRARLRRWGERNNHDIAKTGRIASIHSVAANGVDRPTRYAITEDSGNRYEISGEQLRLASNTRLRGESSMPLSRRVVSNDLDVVVEAGRVRIEGRGFGHGVGLCQHGAEGYARAGVDARTMLDRFYPGSEVRRLWR